MMNLGVRSQNDLFPTIVEQMSIGLVCVSLEGACLLANARLCAILQYSRQEFAHLTYADVTFPEDLSQDLSYAQHLLAGEITSASFEKRYRRKDGSSLWTHTSVSLASDSTPCYFIVTVEDIQAYKQQEHEKSTLFALEAQAREQAEERNEHLLVLQAITDHTLANLSLDDLFRSVLSRIRGVMAADNIAILLLISDRSSLTVRAVDGIEEVIAPDVRIPLGAGFAGTIAARCQPLIAGKDMPVEILTPILREQLSALLGVPLMVGGRVLGVIHIGMKRPRIFTQHDVELFERVAHRLAMAIERTLLAEQAQTAPQETVLHAQHVEEMNRKLQEFVSIVGHEFRTALTGILGFSELLKSADTAPCDVEDYANDIYGDAQRMLRLVTDLLDLDQMQQGKMNLSLQFQLLDFVALLKGQVARHRVTTYIHTLSLLLQPALPPLEGDPDRLKQVVSNLLSNAIKYSPKGGTIQVRCTLEGHLIHLQIQDQGIGIPPEALEHIFEPYHRITAQTNCYIGGTGLGLSISKHLIALHHGTIWVESLLGQGSTFHITLPCAQTSSKTVPDMETEHDERPERSSAPPSIMPRQIFSSFQHCLDAFSYVIHWKNASFFQSSETWFADPRSLPP